MIRMRYLSAVALAACFFPTEPNLGGMPYGSVEFFGAVTIAANAVLRNDTVLVHIVVTNAEASTGGIRFSPCAFAVLGATSSHAWHNGMPPFAGCPDLGPFGLEVPAGEVRQWPALIQTANSLRQTSSPTRYTITVHYHNSRDGRLRRVPAGALVF